MPSATAPNTGNYSIFTAVVKFMKLGASTYRHLGNAPRIDFTVDLDILEHKSVMAGVAAVDFEVVRSKSATVVMDLEEWVPENIAMAALGELSGSPPAISILSQNATRGALRIIGMNDIGVRLQWDYPTVSIRPSGTLSLISDEWASMELTAKVLGPDFGTVRPDITAEVPTGSPPV